MIYRWWETLTKELNELNSKNLSTNSTKNNIYPCKVIHGNINSGSNTYISEDVLINGNIDIGENCMIGTGVILRGDVKIGNNVRIGYGVEIKDSVIQDNTCIGPLCYIGNSYLEKYVYLGAMVRTSNHRLDKKNVTSWNGEEFEDTGMEKLGCLIKTNCNLGISVIILPGRIVPENSIFGPNIVITRNFVPGKYILHQEILKY